MTRTVGWYVHHHGRGHVSRFLAVRPLLTAEVVAFSTLPAPADLPGRTTWVQLPRDDDAGTGHPDPRKADPTARGLLHWAPQRHPGHRARLAAIAQASVEHALDAFVVDVSVEVVLWARMLGLPTVVVTQPGERTDAPHALAYRAADLVLAPWAEGVMPAAARETAPGRVVFAGGISRFDGRERAMAPEPSRVLLLGHVAEPARATAVQVALAGSGWTVETAGADPRSWCDDPWESICRAEVVVSAAGQNSVADLAAAGARAVVLAQERPFAEQAATARALERKGLAVVADGPADPARIAGMAHAARALDGEWSPWRVRGAASRAAAAIAEVAG